MTSREPVGRVARFEIHRAKRWLGKPRFYVRLIGANNKTLSHTETFNSKDAAHNNIDAQKVAVNNLKGIQVLDFT
jgi:uncharacterized protein YegP (UPF0339 family)